MSGEEGKGQGNEDIHHWFLCVSVSLILDYGSLIIMRG